MTAVTLEFIAERLAHIQIEQANMRQLLLPLNNNVTATNRRLERISLQLSNLTGEVRRVDHRLQALELRVAELAVRLDRPDARSSKRTRRRADRAGTP